MEFRARGIYTKLLPEPLDFFILLSSLSGVCGNAPQSNYASGCNTYIKMPSLGIAFHEGRKAVSLDVWLDAQQHWRHRRK